jgi:hypothetical protein
MIKFNSFVYFNIYYFMQEAGSLSHSVMTLTTAFLQVKWYPKVAFILTG